MNILRNTLLTSAAVIALAVTSVPMASAVEPVKQEQVQFKFQGHTEIRSVLAPPAVSSPKTASIKFDAPAVSSKPAPVVIPEPAPQPVVAAQAAPVAPAPAATTKQAVKPAPAQAPTQPAPVAAPLAAPVAPAPAPAPASGVGGALAASAMGQIGIAQDCTRMVENALGSIGIVTGDIGPINFFRYGQVVGDPQPGDLMIQGNAHVAIYVGNGQAVSGGFNGQNTVLHPASYLGGASYVRVG